MTVEMEGAKEGTYRLELGRREEWNLDWKVRIEAEEFSDLVAFVLGCSCQGFV